MRSDLVQRVTRDFLIIPHFVLTLVLLLSVSPLTISFISFSVSEDTHLDIPRSDLVQRVTHDLSILHHLVLLCAFPVLQTSC